jgi:hypothetical protein
MRWQPWTTIPTDRIFQDRRFGLPTKDSTLVRGFSKFGFIMMAMGKTSTAEVEELLQRLESASRVNVSTTRFQSPTPEVLRVKQANETLDILESFLRGNGLSLEDSNASDKIISWLAKIIIPRELTIKTSGFEGL